MNLDFLDSSIDDLEFSKRLTSALEDELDGLTAEDFDLDPIQAKKLTDLVEFFRKAAEDLGGSVDEVHINPLDPPSGVTASFIVFDLSGEEIQRFCDVIRNCSAISMDVTDKDEICISCTIPGVFVLK